MFFISTSLCLGAGIDMVNVLEKQKQELKDIRIKVEGSRPDAVPALFEQINIHFDLYGNLDEPKVKRALALTFEKYCSVAMTLSATANIDYTYSIHNTHEI